MRQKGTVSWFNEKGFGFILADGGGRQLFVHYRQIAGSGYRSLNEGDKVEFVAMDGPKGPYAVDVTRL